jgi:hypothetical protein
MSEISDLIEVFSNSLNEKTNIIASSDKDVLESYKILLENG